MTCTPNTLARLGLTAAAALTTSIAAAPAQATQTHVLQPNETIAAVARHFHVTVHDIAEANRLANVDSVPDGKRLVIPPPPKRVRAEATLHHTARIASDRASLRLGPGTEYRRTDFCDVGAAVVITARRDDWVQIVRADGKQGWVRQDFVTTGHKGGQQVAGDTPRRDEKQGETPRRPHHHAPALAADERDKKRRRVAHHTSVVRLARKHDQEVEPKQVAHHKHALKTVLARHPSRSEERTALRSRRKREQLAQAEHRHRKHSIQMASVHTGRHHHFVAEADAPPANNDIVRSAYAYRGTPYRYGGAARGGFDCSGFTSYLYRQKGISLPHSARSQFTMGRQVGKGGMKAGDLVFFHTVTPGISHVGMYVGNGKFVHASSRRSGGVRVDSLEGGYYSKAFRGARRFK